MTLSSHTRSLRASYHQTFEIKEKGRTIIRHTLLLNPQSLSQAEEARSSVTQTLGGAYVVDFGSGLPKVTISGTTGYKQRFNADGEYRDGHEEFIRFRNKVYREFVKTNNPDYAMFWYNWEDEDYYQIQPSSFRLQRSTSEALLYRYELMFTCLSEAHVKGTPIDPISSRLDFISLGNRCRSAISNITEVRNRFKSHR